MTKVKTQHKFFTLSGITARVLIFSAQRAKEPHDMLLAASFGIVEILGAKRFFKIVGKAVKHQFRELTKNANSNKKSRATINTANKDIRKPG